MQTTGFITINGNEVKLLIRDTKTCRYLRKRDSGKPGVHLTDEEQYLTMCVPDKLDELLKGETVCL